MTVVLPMREITDERTTYEVLHVHRRRNTGLPTGGDPYGNGTPIVLSERESRLHGEGE